MNKKLLQKVLDALNKDPIDVSYIRGIVETILDMQENITYNAEIKQSDMQPIVSPNILSSKVDLSAAEQAVLDAENLVPKFKKNG